MHADRQPTTRPRLSPAHLASVALASIAIAFAGCASRVVEVSDQPPPRHAGLAPPPALQPPQPVHGDAPRDPAADERPRPYGDPRAMRTADGRPAPYGRDPETGRAINDPPPAPAPPRFAQGSRPLPAPAAVGAKAAAKADPRSIVVAKGDTLHSLAKRYGVSVDDLKRANALAGDQIKIGQKLTIPGA